MPPRPGGTICHGPDIQNHEDPGVRFVTYKSRPETATKTPGYGLLQVRAGQKEPPRPACTIRLRIVRFIRMNTGQKKPPRAGVRFITDKSAPRPGGVICYG